MGALRTQRRRDIGGRFPCRHWRTGSPRRMSVYDALSVSRHRSVIMLGVLVIVLRSDDIPGPGFFLGEREISRLRLDARPRWRPPSTCCCQSAPGRSSRPRPAPRGIHRTCRHRERASAAPLRTLPRSSVPVRPKPASASLAPLDRSGAEPAGALAFGHQNEHRFSHIYTPFTS
jgi:hypothetical protein